MSYSSIAAMAQDPFLRERVTACASTQPETKGDPVSWAASHMWQFGGQPGWEQAWDAALAGEVENPGKDPGVITDAMILASTQAIIAGEAEPPGQA